MTPTLDELFDLVAPIFIYHATDVCYKGKALAARRKLRKLAANATQQHDVKPYPTITEDGQTWPEHLDDVYPWATEAYDTLFWAIIEDEAKDEWTWEWDQWSAKQVLDHKGNKVFAGEAAYQFPYYADAECLRGRIREHQHYVAMKADTDEPLYEDDDETVDL